MKKFFLTLFFACGIFVLLSQGELLWSRFKFLDEPRVHKIQKGESLSKLAKQYYGDPQHWRELALVNRAPKPGHLEVGEEILLPSATVIDELRRSRTATRVNALVG
ncbi:MAG: LysM peptidoglycan-binding domain-containing protein, partial [bacterium]